MPASPDENRILDRLDQVELERERDAEPEPALSARFVRRLVDGFIRMRDRVAAAERQLADENARLEQLDLAAGALEARLDAIEATLALLHERLTALEAPPPEPPPEPEPAPEP